MPCKLFFKSMEHRKIKSFFSCCTNGRKQAGLIFKYFMLFLCFNLLIYNVLKYYNSNFFCIFEVREMGAPPQMLKFLTHIHMVNGYPGESRKKNGTNRLPDRLTLFDILTLSHWRQETRNS